MAQKTSKAKRLEEIATGIHKHLRRLEADRKTNPIDPKYQTSRFYGAGASAVASGVSVLYIAYQGSSVLDMEVAAGYLAWLDEGNVGYHYDYERLFPRQKDLTYIRIADEANRDRFRGPSPLDYSALTQSFYALLLSIAPQVEKPPRGMQHDAKYVPNRTDWFTLHNPRPTYHSLPTEQQTLVTELFEAVQDGLDRAYQAGLTEGRDLLAQLAKGDVTVAAFDAHAVTPKSGKRN
jgi:hypothetical protein